MKTYKVLPQSSSIETEVRSSVHPIHSRSDQLNGEVHGDFDDGGAPRLDLPYGGWVEIPVASIRAGNALEDMEMQRRAEVGRYPKLRFDVTKVTAVDGRYRATVDVTAHGQTRRIEEDFTLAVDGRRIVLEGEHTFDMRDFGVNPPRVFTLKVEPQVKVRVRLVADEQAG